MLALHLSNVTSSVCIAYIYKIEYGWLCMGAIIILGLGSVLLHESSIDKVASWLCWLLWVESIVSVSPRAVVSLPATVEHRRGTEGRRGTTPGRWIRGKRRVLGIVGVGRWWVPVGVVWCSRHPPTPSLTSPRWGRRRWPPVLWSRSATTGSVPGETASIWSMRAWIAWGAVNSGWPDITAAATENDLD